MGVEGKGGRVELDDLLAKPYRAFRHPFRQVRIFLEPFADSFDEPSSREQTASLRERPAISPLDSALVVASPLHPRSLTSASLEKKDVVQPLYLLYLYSEGLSQEGTKQIEKKKTERIGTRRRRRGEGRKSKEIAKI